MKRSIKLRKFRNDSSDGPDKQTALIYLESWGGQVAANIHVPLSTIMQLEGAARALINKPFKNDMACMDIVIDPDEV